MKERHIPFGGAMVRSLLNCTKSQTRRVVKPQPPVGTVGVYAPYSGEPNNWQAMDGGTNIVWYGSCPYGQPGDRLWVREAWKAHTTFDHLPPRDIPQSHVWYMADDGYKAESRYRQGMFMPRWASRILLEVAGVRVERLQDISEADAQAEGADPIHFEHGSAGDRGLIDLPLMETDHPYRNGYAVLWETLNGHGSWDANPWVWVVAFKRIEGSAA